MEKIEFIPKLKAVYRYSLEDAILDERIKGGITDEEINDGLYYYDLVDKLKKRYPGVEDVLSADLVMKATQNISFISINNPPIKIYTNEADDEEKYVFDTRKDELQYIAHGLGYPIWSHRRTKFRRYE